MGAQGAPLLNTYEEGRLLWEAKGWAMDDVAAELAADEVLAKMGDYDVSQASLSRKSRSADPMPQPVAEAIERLKTHPNWERLTAIVEAGLRALRGQPMPTNRDSTPPTNRDSTPPTNRDDPRGLAQELLAHFPTDEVARKLADALSKQGGPLGTLRAKFDALASAVVSSLGSLLSTLASITRKLDMMEGKVDHVVSTLAVVAATVNDVDAKADVAALAREREHRRILRAVGRVGGVVCLLGVVGFVSMLVLLASGRLAWAHRDTNSATTASATQPMTVIVMANGGTRTALDLRAFLGAVLAMGKKTEEHWIPKDPFPFQKLGKDCDAGLGERDINGGCWVLVGDMFPPCEKLFRHGDKCYRPVAADPTKPVGLPVPEPTQEGPAFAPGITNDGRGMRE